MDDEHVDTNRLEDLPMGELHQRAESGDAEAIAMVEAFEAGMLSDAKTVISEMTTQATATAARIQEAMMGSATSTLAAVEGALGPRVTDWGPMTMAFPSAPAAAIPGSMAESMRTLDRRAKRMARAIDKILGRPPRRRFVSHLPSRVSR